MMSATCIVPWVLMLPAGRLTPGPLTMSAFRMPPSATQALYWLKGVMETCAQAGP